MANISNLFKLPKNNYTDLYDLARFELTWRVFTAIFYALLAFSIITYLLAPAYLLIIIIALICITSISIILKTTGKYELAAKLFIILSIVVSSSQLFLIDNMIHIVDLVWYLAEVIFGYFVLGKRWGAAGLICFVISLVGYIFFTLDANVDLLKESSFVIKSFQAINAVLATLVLGYIVHHFINTNRIAEDKMQGINKDLSEKQVIIENQNDLNLVMFKEIHHRVKNNLQIISSLLKLQSFETESEEVKNHFNEAIGRIRSMALIHEKMYSNDDLAKINLQSYLMNLSKDICESMKARDDLKINIQSALEKVDIKSMVPISLIFNELITNSLKHGIKEISNGEINIEVKSNATTTEFYYSDNGAWLPPKKEGTFGLELLETLTSQLDGIVARSIENGTNYHFIFKTEALFYA